jgi:hypothetical protein
MAETRYRIDAYSVEFYAVDKKGSRTRWGDRLLRLFSEGREVGQAVFSEEFSAIPEPFLADGKIHYFAPAGQFGDLLKMLDGRREAFILWRPAHDPKEPDDGDALFIFKDKRT